MAIYLDNLYGYLSRQISRWRTARAARFCSAIDKRKESDISFWLPSSKERRLSLCVSSEENLLPKSWGPIFYLCLNQRFKQTWSEGRTWKRNPERKSLVPSKLFFSSWNSCSNCANDLNIFTRIFPTRDIRKWKPNHRDLTWFCSSESAGFFSASPWGPTFAIDIVIVSGLLIGKRIRQRDWTSPKRSFF